MSFQMTISNKTEADLDLFISREKISQLIESDRKNNVATNDKAEATFDLPERLKGVIFKHIRDAYYVNAQIFGNDVQIWNLIDDAPIRLKSVVKSTSVEIVKIDANDDTRQVVYFIHQFNATNREKTEQTPDGIEYREMILAMIPEVQRLSRVYQRNINTYTNSIF